MSPPLNVNPLKFERILAKCPELRKLEAPDDDVEVMETMGKGNYGFVQRAKIRSTGQISAVKVVMIKESELKETWQEVQILRECQHANIVSLLKTYLSGLNLWIALEYCGGGSVDMIYTVIPKPFTEDAISVIINEACKGLEYFHQTFHIHRDIKCGNLLVTEAGEIKLADFGVSSRLQKENLRANSFIGTPFWMAPEVIRCENDREAWYDAKVDVWSIGATTIELADKQPPLSDIHPFTAIKIILNGSQKLGLQNKKRTKLLSDFVQECLERDPKRRPSASQLLKHPFLQKTQRLRSRQLVADLVIKAKSIKSKKHRIEDYDDDDQKYIIAAETTGDDVGSMSKVGEQAEVHQENLNIEGAVIEAKHSFYLEEEVLCADLLADYILLGTERGLLCADLNSMAKSVLIIPSVRFQAIKVLENERVMVAICGKHNHVRQYALSAIHKLISIALDHKMEYLTQRKEEPLLDFIKIPSTKSSTSFQIERTTGSVFMLVQNNKILTLFEWAKAPYSRFMKVKSFWLPEEPKFYRILHDCFFVTEILVVYPQEADTVNAEDCTVKEIPTCAFNEKQGMWRSFEMQILTNAATIKQTLRKKINPKVLAAVSPYEDTIPNVKILHLGSYESTTKYIDKRGNLIPNTPEFKWSSPPLKILCFKNHVAAICSMFIEVCDLKTGQKLQSVAHSCSLEFLCEKNQRIVLSSRIKSKKHQIFVLKHE